ncbi:MAG: hypothetical protein PHX79_01765 [Sphaerochaetaceae bacterium]|nr:hypothetical protein [Sphaerochaetaceae bacterium]
MHEQRDVKWILTQICPAIYDNDIGSIMYLSRMHKVAVSGGHGRQDARRDVMTRIGKNADLLAWGINAPGQAIVIFKVKSWHIAYAVCCVLDYTIRGMHTFCFRWLRVSARWAAHKIRSERCSSKSISPDEVFVDAMTNKIVATGESISRGARYVAVKSKGNGAISVRVVQCIKVEYAEASSEAIDNNEIMAEIVRAGKGGSLFGFPLDISQQIRKQIIGGIL